MRRKVLVATPLLLACLVFGAMPRLAAQQVSDVLTVFRPNGQIFDQLSQLEGSDEDGQHFVWFAIPHLVDPAQFGNATTLCEALPCDKNQSFNNYSDVFGVINIQGELFLGYESDGDCLGCGAIDGAQGAIFLLETPDVPVDATMYLNPTLKNNGWTATFTSDGDVPVPEPGSIMLFGSGVLGLAGVLRRKLIR